MSYTYILGGRYELVGEGTHVHSLQRLMVYRGVDGEDSGKLFICTLVDWASKFTAEPCEPAETQLGILPVEPKVAGRLSTGNPW